MKKQKTTAFVFGGGGSLGAVQVGMLKALSAADIRADFLVGASVGAINAAFFSSDLTYQGAVRLEQIWRNIRRSDVFQWSVPGMALSFLSMRNHICSDEPLKKILEKHLGYERLEDTVLPCQIVATDLFDGVDVSLSQGDVVAALLASAAIPGIFPPVNIGGQYLMDGGVTNNTPISVAIAKGAQRVIVLPTGTSCGLKTPPKGVVEIALQTLNLAISHRLKADMEYYMDKIEIIVVPVLCPLDVSVFDFSRSEQLIHRSETNTIQWLKSGGMERKGNPQILLPHYH